jgi:hypothetical protein
VALQRQEILRALGDKCSKCGFADERALSIDHVNGGGSKERATVGGGYYSMILRRLRDGHNGYQLLCCNCNQIKKRENNEERFRVHVQ